MLKQRLSKRGVDALLHMSQGDEPTLGEFQAALADGLLVPSQLGETVIKHYVYPNSITINDRFLLEKYSLPIPRDQRGLQERI